VLPLAGRALAFESLYPPEPDTRSYMSKSVEWTTKGVVKDTLKSKVSLCGPAEMVRMP
jgi:hypothetical protein